MSELVKTREISPNGRALIRSYREVAHKASAVLFWGDAATGEIENQGTCVFVKLENSVMALTAGHVAEGMQRFIEGGGTACRLGASNFLPPANPRFHPEYPDVDLAVLDVGSIIAEMAEVMPVSI